MRYFGVILIGMFIAVIPAHAGRIGVITPEERAHIEHYREMIWKDNLDAQDIVTLKEDFKSRYCSNALELVLLHRLKDVWLSDGNTIRETLISKELRKRGEVHPLELVAEDIFNSSDYKSPPLFEFKYIRDRIARFHIPYYSSKPIRPFNEKKDKLPHNINLLNLTVMDYCRIDRSPGNQEARRVLKDIRLTYKLEWILSDKGTPQEWEELSDFEKYPQNIIYEARTWPDHVVLMNPDEQKAAYFELMTIQWQDGLNDIETELIQNAFNIVTDPSSSVARWNYIPEIQFAAERLILLGKLNGVWRADQNRYNSFNDISRKFFMNGFLKSEDSTIPIWDLSTSQHKGDKFPKMKMNLREKKKRVTAFYLRHFPFLDILIADYCNIDKSEGNQAVREAFKDYHLTYNQQYMINHDIFRFDGQVPPADNKLAPLDGVIQEFPFEPRPFNPALKK